MQSSLKLGADTSGLPSEVERDSPATPRESFTADRCLVVACRVSKAAAVRFDPSPLSDFRRVTFVANLLLDVQHIIQLSTHAQLVEDAAPHIRLKAEAGCGQHGDNYRVQIVPALPVGGVFDPWFTDYQLSREGEKLVLRSLSVETAFVAQGPDNSEQTAVPPTTT